MTSLQLLCSCVTLPSISCMPINEISMSFVSVTLWAKFASWMVSLFSFFFVVHGFFSLCRYFHEWVEGWGLRIFPACKLLCWFFSREELLILSSLSLFQGTNYQVFFLFQVYSSMGYMGAKLKRFCWRWKIKTLQVVYCSPMFWFKMSSNLLWRTLTHKFAIPLFDERNTQVEEPIITSRNFGPTTRFKSETCWLVPFSRATLSCGSPSFRRIASWRAGLCGTSPFKFYFTRILKNVFHSTFLFESTDL